MLFNKNYDSDYAYFQYINDKEIKIAVNEVGIDDFTNKPSLSERVLQRYSIHIILSGSGNFKFGEKEYRVQTGDALLIFPGMQFRLTHDKSDPWKYFWLNFDGETAAELLTTACFSRENPVYPLQNLKKINSCIRRLSQHKNSNANLKLHAISTLLEIFAFITEERLKCYETKNKPNKNYYVESTLNYLQSNYKNQRLTIESLCRDLAISHSHLCTLFKQQIGMSIYHHLLSLRMQNAKLLLERTEETVTNICLAVGYSTPAYFCCEFKKQTGLSPLEYRKKYKLFLKETSIENKFIHE